MEYDAQQPRVRLDHVPKHCTGCSNAMWRPHLCQGCTRVYCGACAMTCHGRHLVPCPTLLNILHHNKVLPLHEAVESGQSIRLQYADENVDLDRAEIPTECQLCMYALHRPVQCDKCGQVICGACSVAGPVRKQHGPMRVWTRTVPG
jgi:hypothetical protein